MSLTLKKLGIVPLPVAASLTFLFAIVGLGEGLSYSSSLLEVVLNLFILAAAIIVARISVKSFLSTGGVNVLLLGTAVLAFGTMATLASLVANLDPSKGVVIYSIGGLDAGALYLA